MRFLMLYDIDVDVKLNLSVDIVHIDTNIQNITFLNAKTYLSVFFNLMIARSETKKTKIFLNEKIFYLT